MFVDRDAMCMLVVAIAVIVGDKGNNFCLGHLELMGIFVDRGKRALTILHVRIPKNRIWLSIGYRFNCNAFAMR